MYFTATTRRGWLLWILGTANIMFPMMDMEWIHKTAIVIAGTNWSDATPMFPIDMLKNVSIPHFGDWNLWKAYGRQISDVIILAVS
jgi:hypothetical protein